MDEECKTRTFKRIARKKLVEQLNVIVIKKKLDEDYKGRDLFYKFMDTRLDGSPGLRGANGEYDLGSGGNYSSDDIDFLPDFCGCH